MLDIALKAKIPYIGIHTDDIVNVKAILQSIAGKKLLVLPTTQASTVGDAYTYYTDDMKGVTIDIYRKLADSAASCVVINPTSHSLVFDAGVLVVPPIFLVEYLKSMVAPERMKSILQVLNGLSLKSAQEVVQITQARTGSLLAPEIRKTRMMLSGSIPGLYTLDTEYDFYVMPKVLQDWINLNDKYFLNPDTPQKLMPRGILLSGEAGVGKSMASMVIARHWDVPLFRLDISASLNRFLGESESRIARNLQMIEQNAPAVWLLDEAEKLFSTDGGEGTPTRILSQILWWLQYHKAKVLTVMTTNDISKLPKELYRPGRIDQVIEIQKLSLSEAKSFASGVYNNVIGKPPAMSRQKVLRDALDKVEKSRVSHAEVAELVYTLIKEREWLEEND